MIFAVFDVLLAVNLYINYSFFTLVAVSVANEAAYNARLKTW